MSRFYVPRKNIGKDEIMIDGEEAHHILDVMRLGDGDKVVVFDGTGYEYSGFIKAADISAKRLIVEVVRTDKPAAREMPEITLAQAIPKKAKMDYIVEKATELGVSRVVPLISDRTIIRPDERGRGKKAERWRKLAVEAAKQCGRADVPEIGDIVPYKNIIFRMDEYDLVLLACLAEDTVVLKEALTGFISGRIMALIGPEGDFTAEEIRLARRDNCRMVSLGRRVLKSDTAGLFMLSALNYNFM